MEVGAGNGGGKHQLSGVQQLYTYHLLPWMEMHMAIFQQDNDHAHTNRATLDYLLCAGRRAVLITTPLRNCGPCCRKKIYDNCRQYDHMA